ADVLTPAGQPAANGMISQDAPSVALSQGNGTTVGPGEDSAVAGGRTLYDPLTLASQQPLDPNKDAGQGTGNQYFLFGAPGSSACDASAAAQSTKPQKGVHCLIAQVQAPTTTSQAKAVDQLKSGLSPAETAGTQVKVVK